MQRSGHRRRAKRALGLALVLAILAWLGIRAGTGLAPVGGEDADPASDAGTTPTDPPPASADAADRPEPATTPPDPVAEPTTELAPPVVATDPAVADRLWGWLRAMQDEDPNVAFAASDAVAGLDLEVAQRAQVEAARDGLEARFRATFARALESAGGSGSGAAVLAAAAVLRAGFDALDPRPRALVATAFADRGLPPPVAGEAVTLPTPAPLQRGLAVRALDRDGGLFDATVIEDRAGAVTLRRAGARGVTFPTITRAGIEPLGDDPDLALGQAVTALRAGDRLLAAVWIARAHALGGDAARIRELGDQAGR